LDDDISEASLLVEEDDPSPSSLDGRGGGWGDGRDEGMVWEEGPPHSIQTLTFPLSSSKYKQSSCKISNQNHLTIKNLRHRLKVTVSNLVHAKMAMSSLQWYP